VAALRRPSGVDHVRPTSGHAQDNTLPRVTAGRRSRQPRTVLELVPTTRFLMSRPVAVDAPPAEAAAVLSQAGLCSVTYVREHLAVTDGGAPVSARARRGRRRGSVRRRVSRPALPCAMPRGCPRAGGVLSPAVRDGRAASRPGPRRGAPRQARSTQNPLGAMLCFRPATATTDAMLDLRRAGCDPAGFPNGRRPGDDVVDIELRVAMGLLLNPNR
jgi:hypothetical protein